MTDHHPSRRAQQLFQLIQQQARRVLTHSREGAPPGHDPAGGEALLYLGNMHDAVPRGLLYDPLLEPVEQVVWQAIRIHAGQHGAGGFPSQEDLLPITKCGRTRFSWALHILRLTRWVSVSQVRDERGHVKGRVYALHDERASLNDAMLLDPRYVETVNRYCKHRNPRVAAVARTIRDELGLWVAGELEHEDSIGAAPSPQLGRRVETLVQRGRQTGFGGGQSSAKPKVQNLNSGFYGSEKPKVQNLTLGFSGPAKPKVQNVHSGSRHEAKVHILNSGNEVPLSSSSCSSSEENFITTTTTKVNQDEPLRVCARIEWPRRIAERLDDNARRLLGDMAERLPEGVGQMVLDEVSGNLAEKAHSGGSIDNMAGYLSAVLMAAKRGQFVPTRHAQVGRDERAGIVHPRPMRTASPAAASAGADLMRQAKETAWAKGSIIDRLTDRSWAEGMGYVEPEADV